MTVSWSAQQGVYTAFCGLAFVLAYFPLYWHVEGMHSSPWRHLLLHQTNLDACSMELKHSAMDILVWDWLSGPLHQRSHMAG